MLSVSEEVGTEIENSLSSFSTEHDGGIIDQAAGAWGATGRGWSGTTGPLEAHALSDIKISTKAGIFSDFIIEYLGRLDVEGGKSGVKLADAGIPCFDPALVFSGSVEGLR